MQFCLYINKYFALSVTHLVHIPHKKKNEIYTILKAANCSQGLNSQCFCRRTYIHITALICHQTHESLKTFEQQWEKQNVLKSFDVVTNVQLDTNVHKHEFSILDKIFMQTLCQYKVHMCMDLLWHVCTCYCMIEKYHQFRDSYFCNRLSPKIV